MNDEFISIKTDVLDEMQKIIEEQKLKIDELEKLNAYLVGYIEGKEDDKRI